MRYGLRKIVLLTELSEISKMSDMSDMSEMPEMPESGIDMIVRSRRLIWRHVCGD